ncbi:sulfatase-like hydrolase/transferase [Haloferax volcanii]|uniref:Sulfatase-like hydrolase/transferase n=1 Tax=Haloferax volcanii TaxID=2246 RepID=A0A558G9I6_HALVO|nr:sulfatase-like hydrolase/transferase [Haloferax volcanii]
MGQPNIVLLLLDTARADHFGFNGYERNTTPNIDEITEQSIVYENSYSNSIWSLPAYASIFTGELPSEHLAIDWGKSIEKIP